MPYGATTMGFADNVAVVDIVKFLDQITWIANEAVENIRQWLMVVGLQFAGQKTEVVLLTSRKANETITVSVGDCDITSKPSLKYLGVQIHSSLRFHEHLEIVGKKAARVTGTFFRIMPNVRRPRQS